MTGNPEKPLPESALEEAVIRENAVSHDEEAEGYDVAQHYVRLAVHNERVDREVETIFAAWLREPRPHYRVLDIGCGTGFVTAKIVRHPGVEIDAVDVSAGMLAVMKKKLADTANIRYHLQEARSFLGEASRRGDRYDLVVYGTVLHHLFDYLAILEMGLALVTEGGFVYILNEPFRKVTLLEMGDAFLHRLLRSPRGLPRSILNVLLLSTRYRFTRYNKTLAEYHFYRGGIDREAVRACLARQGFNVMSEKSYPLTKFVFTYRLARRVPRWSNHFSLLGVRRQS